MRFHYVDWGILGMITYSIFEPTGSTFEGSTHMLWAMAGAHRDIAGDASLPVAGCLEHVTGMMI